MKTKRLLAMLLVAALCVLFCSGCANKSYIGEDKAKAIALAAAGKTDGDIRDYKCELDSKFLGRTIYEIDFEVGNAEYEYEIDALTGEIVKSEMD